MVLGEDKAYHIDIIARDLLFCQDGAKLCYEEVADLVLRRRLLLLVDAVKQECEDGA